MIYGYHGMVNGPQIIKPYAIKMKSTKEEKAMTNNALDKLFSTGEAVIGAARDVTDAVSRGYDSIRNPIQVDSRRNAQANYYGQPAQPANYDKFVTEYPYSSCSNANPYGAFNYGPGYQAPQNTGYYGFTDPTYGKIGATALNTSRNIFGNGNFGNGGIFSNGSGDIFGGGL